MPAPGYRPGSTVELDTGRRPPKPGVDRTRQPRPPLGQQRSTTQDFMRNQGLTKPATYAVNPGPGQQQLTADRTKLMNTAIQAADGSLGQLQMQQALAQQQASYLNTLASSKAPDGRTTNDAELANAKGQNSGNVSLGQFSGSLPDFKWDKSLVQWKGTTLNATAMSALQLASKILGSAIKGGGFRTHQSQVNLYQEKPGLAAPPGQSWHELGMAIDITSKITPQLVAAMKKAGWVQFDKGLEPWHFSYKEPH